MPSPINTLKSLISLDKLGKVGEVLSGIKDTLFLTGFLEKKTAENGEVSYKPKASVMRALKVPGKWAGSQRDEELWQAIKRLLTPPELDIAEGWLDYLEEIRENDDLIYFWGKSFENSSAEEIVQSLRIYMRHAKTAPNRKALYKAMTTEAINDHIITAESFTQWLKDNWEKYIWPWLKKQKKRKIDATAKKATAAVNKNTRRTIREHRAWVDKKKGW